MIQTCEINPEGTYYAFGGEEGKIMFGHLNKGEPVEVENGHLGTHDNRIFCLKWHTGNTNLLLSGGWDRSVHFWDIRVKTSTKQLFGYYIGGEAIDIRGDEILLGNNQPQLPLRIYDSKADKVRNVEWPLTNKAQ
jgi:WD40 repeat protein